MTDKETDRVNVAPDRPCVRAESAGALEEAERARFERVHCGGNRDAIRRNTTTGDYVLPCIADAWAGWRSAAEHYSAPAVVSDNVQKMEGDSASSSSRGGTSPEVEEALHLKFDCWLKTVCFQKPPDSVRELAWEAVKAFGLRASTTTAEALPPQGEKK